MNTCFDYWRGTVKSLNRSCKILAGWTVTYGQNQIHGGISPSILAIKSSKMEIVKNFKDALLGSDTGNLSMDYIFMKILLIFYSKIPSRCIHQNKMC